MKLRIFRAYPVTRDVMHRTPMDISLISDRDRELLANYCDFVIGAQPSGLAMLPTSDTLELIAGDGMGGCFYRWHVPNQNGHAPIVYLSQYGETSRFASSLEAALSIVASHPSYWCDVLAAGHKSDELMAQVIERYEAKIEDVERDAVVARTQLQTTLPIENMDTHAELICAIRTEPQFRPLLDNGDGTKSEGASFADRPFPR